MGRDAKRKTVCFLTAGAAAVLLAAVLSILYGSTGIPPGKILDAVLRPDLTDRQHLVIRELRIPRTAGCILVGAAFSAAGAMMQGVTRNPLADSGLLGINAGASFALALCLAFLPGLGFSGVVFFSFLGAAGAMFTVYGLMSLNRRGLDPVRLVLAGSAVSIFLSSLSQAVAILCKIGYNLTFWTAGGVAGIRGKQLIFAGPVILLGLAAATALSGRVALLSLGEEAARGLGLSVERSRTVCLFVVLMVPHVVRYFTGADYRSVIPCSMVAGAFFMLAADILSRMINAPGEVPIGLVFAVVGVPFFIWTARKEERTFE